jgi:anaerobic magnesium-protoporphyrin IX monomethyl ester cyclase
MTVVVHDSAQSTTAKIVLVVPPLIHAGVAFTSVAGPEHIGIAYLAAALRREGLSTEILNFDLDTYLQVMKHDSFREFQPTPQEMADVILARDPGFVGVTVTGPTLELSLALAGELKQRRPDLHICFGGHQATAAALPLMTQEPAIDSIGLGDCDFTLPAFARAVLVGEDIAKLGEEGRVAGFYHRNPDHSVAGGWKLGARKGDLIRLEAPGAPARPALSDIYALWDLPHPARDDLAKIRQETDANEARLSSSRGCMDFCTFCATSDRAGFRRHTLRPPDDVVAEITDLHERFGIDHFWLVDDNFVSRSEESQKRAEEICVALQESPLRVTMRAYFRADAFGGRPDLLGKMFDAGVTMGLIGVETATPRRLKYFGKGCSSAQVRQTVAGIRAVGMGLQIGYIFFDPLTSFPDMRADTDFLLELDEAYNLFNFVQSMDVYPGTPYRRMIQKKGVGHFEHEYRGGFRQYTYEDPRIGPLATAVDKAYDPPLMAIDRSLMRLRAFNLPRLRWLNQSDGLDNQQCRTYEAVRDESEEHFATLAAMHHSWMHETIDNAETGLDEDLFYRSVELLRGRRRPPLVRLESLAREADRMASALHARANGRRPSGAMEREDAAWPL